MNYECRSRAVDRSFGPVSPSCAEDSPTPYRSSVPDLLFEDVRELRIEDLRGLLDTPEKVNAATPFHRLTVFLTYRCNLDCPYCKTIARSPKELLARPEKKKTFTLEQFRSLLASHAGTPIRHIHFTGGEAALVRDLPAMVNHARQTGVEQLSITSNGTLPFQQYMELIAAGIKEIRISIDAADPLAGQHWTGRQAAWHASVRTVRALASARKRGAPFFLILNTVVSIRQVHELPRILSFLLSLEPDDVKLITNVDQREELAKAAEKQMVRDGIGSILSKLPSDSFPLLRRKLRTVFCADAIGLENIKSYPRGAWRCYIPLTERTVDAVFYYPCSVYNREGGRPLGHLDESPELQRTKTASFVRHADCLSDPICRRYCLHCTKEYNRRANEERG